MQIKNNGNMGLGIQASTGASGSDWMRIKPMNDHLVGINYEYFSQTASTGAKIALNMKVDNGTTNSPFGYINILDSRDNGTFNKSGLSIDITDGGLTPGHQLRPGPGFRAGCIRQSRIFARVTGGSGQGLGPGFDFARDIDTPP